VSLPWNTVPPSWNFRFSDPSLWLTERSSRTRRRREAIFRVSCLSFISRTFFRASSFLRVSLFCARPRQTTPVNLSRVNQGIFWLFFFPCSSLDLLVRDGHFHPVILGLLVGVTSAHTSSLHFLYLFFPDWALLTQPFVK